MDLLTRLPHPGSVGPLFLADSFSRGRLTRKAKKKILKIFFSSYAHHLVHVRAPHLRTKSPMGSIEVSIDREYPHEEHINFPHIAIHFYGRCWPSKWEKAKKRHSRHQVGMIAWLTRPQNFFAWLYYGSIHPHKISDRYNSPYPYKNAVTEWAS